MKYFVFPTVFYNRNVISWQLSTAKRNLIIGHQPSSRLSKGEQLLTTNTAFCLSSVRETCWIWYREKEKYELNGAPQSHGCYDTQHSKTTDTNEVLILACILFLFHRLKETSETNKTSKSPVEGLPKFQFMPVGQVGIKQPGPRDNVQHSAAKFGYNWYRMSRYVLTAHVFIA